MTIVDYNYRLYHYICIDVLALSIFPQPLSHQAASCPAPGSGPL